MKLVKVILGGLMLAAAPLAALAEDMSYSYRRARLRRYRPRRCRTTARRLRAARLGRLRGELVRVRRIRDALSVQRRRPRQDRVGVGGHYGIYRQPRPGRPHRLLQRRSNSRRPDSAVRRRRLPVDAGLRGQVGETFELEGHVIHTDLGDGPCATRRSSWRPLLLHDRAFATAEHRTDDGSSATLDVCLRAYVSLISRTETQRRATAASSGGSQPFPDRCRLRTAFLRGLRYRAACPPRPASSSSTSARRTRRRRRPCGASSRSSCPTGASSTCRGFRGSSSCAPSSCRSGPRAAPTPTSRSGRRPARRC